MNLKRPSVVPDISVSLTDTPVSKHHSLDQFWVLIREQVHVGTVRTQRCPTHSDPFCNYYFISILFIFIPLDSISQGMAF